MSLFEDCDKINQERIISNRDDRREIEEIRIPITVVGSSLAIVIQCPDCSEKHNLCKELKKDKKHKKH